MLLSALILIPFFGIFFILSYNSYDLNENSKILVPSGCPLGLLPLLVLMEFISYFSRPVLLCLIFYLKFISLFVTYCFPLDKKKRQMFFRFFLVFVVLALIKVFFRQVVFSGYTHIYILIIIMFFTDMAILCFNHKKNINLNIYMYKYIYIPLGFALFIVLNISLPTWLMPFLYITFIDLYILKMDTFGFSKGSSSSGAQGGEGSSGSGKDPNNKGFKRPFEVNDSDSDRERKAKVPKPITTQAAILPEDTLLYAKGSVVSLQDKYVTINSIYNRLKLIFDNMNIEQRTQFVDDFEQAVSKWDNKYNALTLKDTAIMKMCFAMALDWPLSKGNGYQADFMRKRDLSESTRGEARQIVDWMKSELKVMHGPTLEFELPPKK